MNTGASESSGDDSSQEVYLPSYPGNPTEPQVLE